MFSQITFAFLVTFGSIVARFEFLYFVARQGRKVAKNIPVAIRKLALVNILVVGPVLEAGGCCAMSFKAVPCGTIAEASFVVHRPRPFRVTGLFAFANPSNK